MREVFALVAAAAAGIAIAYIDSRPGWDDTGITAFGLLGAALVIALASPRRPWLTALAVGIWIPAHAWARSGDPKSLVMLVVVGFPLAGAYAGAAVRRAMSGELLL
jgi:hypothetical protein